PGLPIHQLRTPRDNLPRTRPVQQLQPRRRGPWKLAQLVRKLLTQLPDAARQSADSIARRGRAVAVTLLIATQRPTQAAMGHGAVLSAATLGGHDGVTGCGHVRVAVCLVRWL